MGGMRTSILDTRVMRGADVYSEHLPIENKNKAEVGSGWGDEESKG